MTAKAITRSKKIKEKIIRSKSERICLAVVFVIFCIYAATLIYPFVFLLMNSFKSDPIEMLMDPLGFPKSFSFSTYSEAMDTMNIGEMFFNSVTLAVGQTFVTMALTCMAAYTLAKYRFKGNGFIYTFVLIASVVPTIGAEAATFNLMNEKLHLRNTYLGMMLMCGGFGGAFLYLHSFFKELPWSFAESAMIDGASDFRVFLQIMLPLAKNGIMVFTLMRFLGSWNEYWTAFLYYGEHPTLAVGLSKLSSRAGQDIPYGVFFAGTIICIMPVLIFYAFFSKKLMQNLIGGGIKG